jgi:hypothetical protein
MIADPLFAEIGRQHLEIQDRKAAFGQLLELLAKVVSGEIEIGRVLVNLTEQSWSYAPLGERPGLPPTINGLPRCVVAPEPQEQPGFFDDKGPVTITGRNLFIRRAEDAAA